MKRPGWNVDWQDLGTDKVEVFTGPDGRRWKRVEKGEPGELELPMPYGLPALRLTNIDHWFAPVEAR